jgi:hypothetical protein
MNFKIYWWGIKYLKNILIFHGDANIPCITFELYNFVQMTFYHQCEELCNIFIYLIVILSME